MPVNIKKLYTILQTYVHYRYEKKNSYQEYILVNVEKVL